MEGTKTMAKPIITILGLGTLGASLGLALQRSAAQAEIVGHDKVPEASQLARKNNVVQRVEWNLHAACEPASLIVLAMPVGEIAETLELIREDVQPNALVFVLSDVLQPAAQLIEEKLGGPTGGQGGSQGHAVVGHPIITGVGGPVTPRADMFDKTTFVVAAGAATDPSALELAANFVESIGAQPLFMDPVEHDGLIAGVEQLPQLLGLATVHMLAAAPGWTEARRLAGRTFAQSTDSGRSAENLYAAMRGNRANLLMRLDQFERELAAWKAWLAADDEAGDEASGHPLQAAITDSRSERERWEEQAQLHDWVVGEPVVDSAAQPSGGLLRQMFFGSWGAKKDPPQGSGSPKS
jgi:prephenate dehydrogenase